MCVMPLSSLHFPLLSSPLSVWPSTNESTDASRILFEPPPRSGGNLADSHAIPGSGLLLTTWQTPTLGFGKQERQLRTGSTGGCLQSIAQCTRSGACSYWIGATTCLSSSGNRKNYLCLQFLVGFHQCSRPPTP